MELENLKYIWRTMEHVPVQEQNSREQDNTRILALLEKKSRSPITRMRKNLVGELVLMLATYIPAMGWYLFGYGGRLSEMAWLLLLLTGLFAGYYYRKNKLLKEMQCLNCPIRSNLERQVKMLRKYIRFYTVAGTLLIPVVAICAFLLIRSQLPQPEGTFFFSWVIALAPITTGIYYINTWYVNKMYGRHITRLQQLLEEMGEE
jgi:hypothetical protein